MTKRNNSSPDWMQMETRMREALSRYKRGRVSYAETLHLIDGALAVCTGRGNCLPVEGLSWKSGRYVANAEQEVGVWWDMLG